MGREVQTQAQWGLYAGPTRALLESDAMILRGAIRARLPRPTHDMAHVQADTLHLATPDGPLSLTMPAGEAAKWLAALAKPLPTLAGKLGLAGQRLWLLTPTDDAALLEALATATPATGRDATLALAVLLAPADLAHLCDIARAYPALTLWALNAKGPDATLPEAAIRTTLRNAGLIDSKSCAVSPALSATRYARRRT